MAKVKNAAAIDVATNDAKELFSIKENNAKSNMYTYAFLDTETIRTEKINGVDVKETRLFIGNVLLNDVRKMKAYRGKLRNYLYWHLDRFNVIKDSKTLTEKEILNEAKKILPQFVAFYNKYYKINDFSVQSVCERTDGKHFNYCQTILYIQSLKLKIEKKK